MQFVATTNHKYEPYLFWKKFIESELSIRDDHQNNLSFVNSIYENICFRHYSYSEVRRINHRIILKYYDYEFHSSEVLKVHFGVVMGILSKILSSKIKGRILVRDNLVAFFIKLTTDF